MNNPYIKMDKARIHGATPVPRIPLHQLPGFIPLKTGDAIPDALRQALNVDAYVYELRKIAQQVIESELEP